MKFEGQVRIPSGCAISAVISKEGNKMSGEMIINSMKPMHDRSNGLGGGFAGYGIYPQYKDFYALHMFFDTRDTRKKCEAFLKDQFEIVQSEIIPTRKIPVITNEPIIWRYFVAPLQSVLTSLQLDENEFVARTVMKINAEMPGAYVFSSGKNMGTFKAVGFPEDVGIFINWMNMRDIPGLLTDVIQQTLLAGGAVHIHLHYLIILLYIMVKFHLMMRIADLWKCSATNVHSKPIQKLLLTSWIICSVYRDSPLEKLQASLLLLSGVLLKQKQI